MIYLLPPHGCCDTQPQIFRVYDLDFWGLHNVIGHVIIKSADPENII